MADVSVARLSIRAPPGRLAETRMRSEDALRLVGGSEDRLLVLRRLDLGVMPVRASAAQWEARAGERMRELRNRAIHAAQPGAADADAVWFRSPEEARALLLLLLASGRAANAWFWRLAVRDWRGLTPMQWVADWLRDASGRSEATAALARAIVAAIAAGHGETVLQWLEAAPVPEASVRATRAAGAMGLGTPEPEAEAAAAEAAERAEALIGLLERVAAGAVRRLVLHSPASPAAREALVRFALVAAAPELAAAPGTVAVLAQALRERAEAAAAAAPVVRGSEPPPAAPPAHLADPVEPRHEADRSESPDAALAESRPDATAPVVPDPPSAAAAEDRPLAPVPAPSFEQASAGAGTLLLVRPLWRMGFSRWIEARPDLLAAGFGRALLADAARRMRVEPDDPLFATLGAVEAEIDPQLLALWRVGLDRWLRRSVRLTLANLVRRRGWLIRRDEGIDVRFDAESADVRLRRRALDLDPGWVDWLGLVVRYHYRDEPMT